jgi:GR25 family glycosyltransferase involved in LPS biosynthesis
MQIFNLDLQEIFYLMKIPLDKIVFINMDKSTFRRKNLLDHFAELNLKDKNGNDPIRINGIDGNFVKHQVIPKKSSGHSGLPISISEIGCYAAHREIMEMQIENGWEYVMYLEDDVRFNKKNLETLIANWDSLPEFEMLNLSWAYYKRPEDPVWEKIPFPGLKNFYKGDGMWLCQSYILSLSGAKYAYEYTSVQTHGLDWHYSTMQTNMKSYGFKYGEISRQDNRGSGMRSTIIHTS